MGIPHRFAVFRRRGVAGFWRFYSGSHGGDGRRIFCKNRPFAVGLGHGALIPGGGCGRPGRLSTRFPLRAPLFDPVRKIFFTEGIRLPKNPEAHA